MSDEFGFWTVDGLTTFGTMPGGILPGIADPLPIKLQNGDAYWGAAHIEKRHGRWLQENKHSAASMVYLKLTQTGIVYAAGDTNKSKIRLTLAPAVLLILKYIPSEHFLSVTSLYLKKDMPDGDELGRYYGSQRGRAQGPRPVPVFAAPNAAIAPLQAIIQPATPAGNAVATLNTPASNGPIIVYKKRRSI